MDPLINKAAEQLASRIRHDLITSRGVTVDKASHEEFYRAFCLALRESITINWAATMRTYAEKKTRMLYYICIEYLPGRFIESNLVNTRSREMVNAALGKLGRSFADVSWYEYDPGLGYGGLGRLASCYMDSLATLRYPAMGYGLRYHYGHFNQEVWDGKQVELPDTWLLHENPWEFRRDSRGVDIHYGGHLNPRKNAVGEEVFDLSEAERVHAIAYDYPIIGYSKSEDYNAITLRLWSVKESPVNFQMQRFNAGDFSEAAENTALTDVLYPNDQHENGKRIRIKQEFLLASASICDILKRHRKLHGCVRSMPDLVRIQINDTHPSFAIIELMRRLTTEDQLPWNEAWEITKECCGYTCHTILSEALEQWDESRIENLFPIQMQIIRRLDQQLKNEITSHFGNDIERSCRMALVQNGRVRMANLALYGSHRVNGVAQLHTEILRGQHFADFHQMDPHKICNVTNGVTQRRWLLTANPRLSAFLSKHLGDEWVTDLKRLEDLRKVANDPAILEELREIKRQNKRDLIDYLKVYNPLRDARGAEIGRFDLLTEEALFDVQIKRIHEYKRQLMNVLHVLMLINELKKDPNARSIKRMVIISGKAAAGYTMAKNIVHLITCLNRRLRNLPSIHEKLCLLFVENYNVARAEQIIPAADLSEQISCAGMEASGTGNMKLAMNGALTIGTDDGANIEMKSAIGKKYWPFSFGASAEENARRWKNGEYDSKKILENDPEIAEVVAALVDGSLAETTAEHEALAMIHDSLVNGGRRDHYFVLGDLRSYYETQKQVEALYVQPSLWAEMCMHNIAAMGGFSSDASIKAYAEKLWDLEPLPVTAESLTRVREEYTRE